MRVMNLKVIKMNKATNNPIKLTLADLKKGEIVRESQLNEIYDTCMLLLNSKLLPDGDVEGELIYFGDSDSDEYNNWFFTGNAITPLYFESAECINGVVYDE